jgi:hypothetical protein
MDPEELSEEARLAKEMQEVNELPEVKEMQEALRKLANQEDENSNIDEESTSTENSDENFESNEEPIFEAKRETKGDKYRKLQNDKYRALAEKEEALRRADRLEQMLKESLNSGTYHYGRNVYSELERAKEDKRRAIDEGDAEGLIEADVSINKALLAINELEKWGNESEVSNSSYEPEISNEVIYTEIANDWLDTHPYLQPHSRSYNPKVAEKVSEFVNYLDYNLQRNNESNAIFSEDYFNTIDNYIDSLRVSKKDNSKNIESLSNVSSVRNSSAYAKERPMSEEANLSKLELKIIENSASSPEEKKKMISDWIRNKKEDSKINRNRR